VTPPKVTATLDRRGGGITVTPTSSTAPARRGDAEPGALLRQVAGGDGVAAGDRPEAVAGLEHGPLLARLQRGRVAVTAQEAVQVLARRAAYGQPQLRQVGPVVAVVGVV
jgi:hypothetical protein